MSTWALVTNFLTPRVISDVYDGGWAEVCDNSKNVGEDGGLVFKVEDNEGEGNAVSIKKVTFNQAIPVKPPSDNYDTEDEVKW